MIEPGGKMIVGRVLRASTQGFDCGAHSTNIGSHHDFGALVKVPVANVDAFLAWMLSFDDRAEIIGPEHLRRLFVRRIETGAS